MSNQNIWRLDTDELINTLYFFDLGFHEENDFSYWFSLNQIKAEDITEAQNDEMRAYVKKASHQCSLYHSFCPIDDNLLPATMYVTFEFDRTVVLPDLFQIGGGYLIMSEALARVLQSCQLGKTKIIPIRFFDLVHHEYVNDITYYLLNVAERHQYFLPELTKPKPAYQYTKNDIDVYWEAIKEEEHHHYVYSRQALACPVDLWNDPSLSRALYMSDRLMKALQQAGFADIIDLWRCRLA